MGLPIKRGQTHDPHPGPNSRADLLIPCTKLQLLSTEHSVQYKNKYRKSVLCKTKGYIITLNIH